MTGFNSMVVGRAEAAITSLALTTRSTKVRGVPQCVSADRQGLPQHCCVAGRIAITKLTRATFRIISMLSATNFGEVQRSGYTPVALVSGVFEYTGG